MRKNMEGKSRAAELERLAAERWAEQQRAHAAEQQQLQESQQQRDQEAPTGSHLFWRPNPFSEAANAHVKPYVRTNEECQKLTNYRGKQYMMDSSGNFVPIDEVKENAKTRGADSANEYKPAFSSEQNSKLLYVPVSGHDALSLKPNSQYKYRIPNDSVVNKVGDCKLCLCCGWRLTAAQWIWWPGSLFFLQ